MIRSYRVKHYANENKVQKIEDLLYEYRRTAKKVSNVQWRLFYTKYKFNKNYSLDISTKLSDRCVQTCEYQVVGMLESYISNVQNRFIDVVQGSNLDEDTRIKLFYINKYKKYFKNEINMKSKPIDRETIILARKIFKHLTKRKPTYKNINMMLDGKIVDIYNNDGTSKFDYWIKISTLDTGHRTLIPIKTNKYFEKAIGKLKNSIQINAKKNKLEVVFMKEREREHKTYIPLTPKIAIDVGLKVLIATDKGDLFSRNFYKKLCYYDKITIKLQKELQKQNIRLSKNERYMNLVSIKRNYVKNEINKAINRMIVLYSPSEIVLERLNFNNSNMSRQMNRLINTFGKQQIELKLKCIEEELGIKITHVNAAYTSKQCSSCGYVAENNRDSQSEFLCKICGNHINADVNAAKNILVRSSYKDLADIYASRRTILYKLLSQFVERTVRPNSRAKDVIRKNRYFNSCFPDYVQKYELCNICI